MVNDLQQMAGSKQLFDCRLCQVYVLTEIAMESSPPPGAGVRAPRH
jgi:hypothetical protein